ncbi:MAG: hypothetical protein AABX25_04105 [Nanoarchaeota archaeon]
MADIGKNKLKMVKTQNRQLSSVPPQELSRVGFPIGPTHYDMDRVGSAIARSMNWMQLYSPSLLCLDLEYRIIIAGNSPTIKVELLATSNNPSNLPLDLSLMLELYSTKVTQEFNQPSIMDTNPNNSPALEWTLIRS